ncbi:MAG: DUF4870 domain-containing protein [Anaerolineae bacterium]
MSLEAMMREYEVESEEMRLGADGEIEYISKRKNDEKAKRGLEINVGEYVHSTQQERTLAALAHIMPWLMLLIGLGTQGIAVPLLLIATAVIYFNYKDRSEFIGRNALEALKAQLIGTLGWAVIPAILSVIAVIIIIPLAISIVGILLIPFVVLALVLGVLASVLLPIALMIFSVIGALQAFNGEVYHYPLPNVNMRRVPQQVRSAPYWPWNWQR